MTERIRNTPDEMVLDIVLRKENLMDTFFNEFPSIFSIIDPNGKFVMANDHWNELGWSKSDLRNLPIQDLICDDCKHKFTDFFVSKDDSTSFRCKIFNKQHKLIESDWRLKQNGKNVYCTANLIQ